MRIKYYNHIYDCEEVSLHGVKFYKGYRVFKNGRIGKRVKYFVPESNYYEIIT